MSKREFRFPRAEPCAPAYPDLDSFNRTRREFLLGLGAVVGASSFAALLAGCGGRPATAPAPDGGTPPGSDSTPRKPDGKRPPQGDAEVGGPTGAAPLPPSQADQGPLGPDGGEIWGDVSNPDAEIDKVDQGYSAGGKAGPSAPGDGGPPPR
jgi:hypothetical protein